MKLSDPQTILALALFHKSNDKELCKNYHTFFREAWKVLEPDNHLIDNWHIKYLCDIIEKETIRIVAKKPKNKDYIINIPPRSAKSRIFNVMWCPWAWTRWPYLKFINNSFEQGLATALCLESRRLIESNWYQRNWGESFDLTTDQNTKSWYDNDKRGMRRSASTRGGVTGTGADIIISDDPQDPQMGESDVEREMVKDHWGKTLYSRLNNQRIGLRVVIQQRLNEDDITGYLMANNPEKYEHICIPAEATPDIKPDNLRKNYKNGLFFPDHPSFNPISLAEAKLATNLGEYGYSGQMLQNPSPAEGGLFKRHWWRFWKPADIEVPPVKWKDANGNVIEAVVVDLPRAFEKIIDSWDPAFKGEMTSDDVVGSKWGKLGSSKFLLNWHIDKMTFKQTCDAIRTLHYSKPKSSNTIIERSANGPALKDVLENEIPGIITMATGKLSKEERARINDNTPYTGQVEAGNVYLPHPSINDKTHAWIDEHAKFPKGAQDGCVDSGGQAVNYLTTVKYLFPYYQNMDLRLHAAFEPPTDYTRHYVGMHLSKAGKMSFMAAIWDRKHHRLLIYGEMIKHNPTPQDMALKIFTSLNVRQRPITAMCGNPEMFADDARTVSRLINQELAALCNRYSLKHTPIIREPVMYERNGAIALTNLMFQRSQITVHNCCDEMDRQLSGWFVDKGKPVELGFELCQCLIQIVSELNRTERVIETVKKPPDYRTKVHPQTLKPIEEAPVKKHWEIS